MVWITSVSQAATVTLLSHNPSVHPQVIPTHNMSQVLLNVKSLSEIQTIHSNEDCIGVYETLVTITYRTFRTSLTWMIIFHPLIHFHGVYHHYLSYEHLTLLCILFKSLESNVLVFYVSILCCFETRFTILVCQTSTTGRNSYPAKGRAGVESHLDHESKCHKALLLSFTQPILLEILWATIK